MPRRPPRVALDEPEAEAEVGASAANVSVVLNVAFDNSSGAVGAAEGLTPRPSVDEPEEAPGVDRRGAQGRARRAAAPQSAQPGYTPAAAPASPYPVEGFWDTARRAEAGRAVPDPRVPAHLAPAPRGPVQRDEVLAIPAYAVWVVPGRPDLRGVHLGGEAAWARLSRQLPGGRYVPGSGVHLRRYASTDSALVAYRLEAVGHGAPLPAPVYQHQ